MTQFIVMKTYYAAKNYEWNDVIIAFLKTLALLFLFIGAGLYLDSDNFLKGFHNGQWLANGAMILVFLGLFWRATKRSRELMIYALIIGIVGENILSIGLEMYTYRMHSVPIYVPPGHAIIYISTVYFSRNVAVKKFRFALERLFTVAIFVYASAFLAFYNDVFGFVLTMATILILKNKPRERLMYLTMYLVVAVLEIIGTTYKCWYWPDTAFGLIPFLKSANPPSGISFFYFSLDLGCLWLYKQRHLIAWKRMKSVRLLQTNS